MSDNPPRVDLREKYPTVLGRAFDVSPPPGWEAIVDRLIERMLSALDPNARDQFRISQVKEKFAGLRVYHNGGDEMEALVEEAAEEAERTCDVCGMPGRMRGMSWVAVRCDDHEGIIG